MFELRLPVAAASTAARRAARAGGRLGAAALALLALSTAALVAPAARAAQGLRIATSRSTVSLPLYVALARGFFRDAGLEVTLEDCPTSTRCLDRLLDGHADLASASEMTVVLHSFVKPDLAVIATMANASDNLKLIARRAGGIVRGEQLDGKRIGVPIGTAAQYLLETHLLGVGVDPQHVQAIALQPEQVIAALAEGRVDAIAIWEPYGYQALHGTGGAPSIGVQLPLSGGYIQTANLVAPRRLLGAYDALLVRVLRAVEQAEEFIQSQPRQAQAILRQRLQIEQPVVDWAWPGLGFRLSLDQSLLTTMEGEMRWAQREGHAPGGGHPNVLGLIYPGPLKAVRPSSVGTGN